MMRLWVVGEICTAAAAAAAVQRRLQQQQQFRVSCVALADAMPLWLCCTMQKQTALPILGVLSGLLSQHSCRDLMQALSLSACKAKTPAAQDDS
jgi:hypothetical protein